ncbi:MAG TPA: hypothetical protein VIH61_01785 [Waddliaceae bacterium]
MSLDDAIKSFNLACSNYTRTWPEESEPLSYPNYEQQREPFSEKVEQFGREWVCTRELFLHSTLDSLIASVHYFVVALIGSGFALFEGDTKDSSLKDKAIKAWEDTRTCLRYTGQSIIGVLAPSVAINVDRFFSKKMPRTD